MQVLSVGVGEMERVDYLLELAEWMGSNGVPGADISLLLSTALDALYEVEEQSLLLPGAEPCPEDDDDDDGGADEEEEQKAYAQLTAAAASAVSLGHGPGGLASSSSSVAATRQASRKSSVSRMGGTGTASRVTIAASATGGGPTASAGAAGAGSGAGTGGGGSASRPALGPDGKPIEEKKIPERLSFKMLEQCVRGLTMASMLDSAQAKRTERYLEAVFFVKRALQTWMDALFLCYRKQKYAALTPAERGETPASASAADAPAAAAAAAAVEKAPAKKAAAAGAPAVADAAPAAVYPTFESFEPPVPAFLVPPSEPVLMMAWAAEPSPQIVELMNIALAQCPADVPSKTSLPVVQLTMHYLLLLADGLRCTGFCKYSLLVYSFSRMLLLHLTPAVGGTAAVLASIHFASLRLLLEIGLPSEAAALPQFIPSAEFIAALGPLPPGTPPMPPLTIGSYLVKVWTFTCLFVCFFCTCFFVFYCFLV
jgi:hypothetical protein